jgi:hypothetical protein
MNIVISDSLTSNDKFCLSKSDLYIKLNLENDTFNLTGQEIPLALAGGMN